jgi:UDP-N-acetylglucosamine--N-acetylmuramyl-(pentapeptide) pyrophosphoryl-undecaprenol N-acetylglucosamine transferase
MVPSVDVLFVGTAGGFEARLVRSHGHRLAVIRAAPLLGVGLTGKGWAVITTIVGAAQARRILRRDSVQLVLGLGNYACAPTVLAARSLGLPTVLHEANAVAGLANRLLGRIVDRVLLGFGSAAGAFTCPTTVTGTPVRTEILALGEPSHPHGSPRPGAPFRILVSGGSQGSRFLDERVPHLLARVVRPGHTLEVRHQAAERDVERVEAAYAGVGVRALVVPYIDDMAEAYAWADFAVVCAGAVTLSELAAVGLPALLVPLGSAALDHQAANARAFAEATGVRWVGEDAWDADALAAHVASLITSSAAWSEASAGVRRLARTDAAAAVVRACEALIRRPSPSAARGSRAP